MSHPVNNGDVSDALDRLSLSTAVATALPSSSAVTPALELPGSTPGPSQARRPSPQRAPSLGSFGNKEEPTTPKLKKRASLSSLQGPNGRTSPRSPAFRRSSSSLAASPGSTIMSARSNLPPPAEEVSQPAATVASVAHEYLKKELQMHDDGIGAAKEAQTVVILQDDCYGHRYSRPRTSKATLNTIVERPERIHASVLGLSTAYIRLGGRHAEGHAPPHPDRHPSTLPAGPFHIRKTSRRLSLRSPAATVIHGVKWMTELNTMCDAAESRLALSGKELARPNTNTHKNGNAESDQPKLHEGDLYLCSGSLNALEGALGGVCEGIDMVFKEYGPKRAFVCVRPPGHHCSANMPSGFCWLNNVHVGIGYAALTHGLTHAAIIDFDLHHGDGSQSITWDHNARVSSLPKNTPISKKTAIGYFSLHDINSYPCEMGDEEKVRNASLCIENAHGQTIWNVHLQPWKTDDEFWQLYADRYLVLLSKARSFLRLHSDRLRQAPTHLIPKAAIFLSAGFDASEWESQGMQRHQVNVPTDFYARFTRDVAMMAEEEGLGVDGRVISVLEGGYSDRALISGVLSHVSGLTAANQLSSQGNASNGVGHQMDWRLAESNSNGDALPHVKDASEKTVDALDTSWWSPPQLEKIEALFNHSQPIAAPKKQQHESRPAYTSATQSYTAKIVSPSQGRRSLSGIGANQTTYPGSRGPSPPPPTVDWATAAYELAKLLVPSDRETRSCRPEDLSAEATRARRDRQSSVALAADGPVNELKRMQLRDRKVKLPQHKSDDEQEKPMSRANRRKTIADVSLLAQDIEAPNVGHANSIQSAQRMRRRSSVTSSAGSMHGERGSDFSLGSAADNQAGREPVVAKKARAAAAVRPENSKTKAVRKKPVNPVLPKTVDQNGPTQSLHETSTVPLSENEELKNKDVDQLISGMTQMRIKLNVPPKEEYEARQTAPKPAPRGRPKSTAAKPVKPASPAKSRTKGGKALPAVNTEGPLTPQQLPQRAPVTSYAQDMPMPASAPAPAPAPTPLELQPAPQEIPQPPTTSSATPATSYISTLPASASDAAGSGPPPVHTPSEEFESSIASPQLAQPPSYPEFAAPNTPVTAKRTRQDLPVFTSTSSISFAKPANTSQSDDQNMMRSSNDPTPSALPKIGSDPQGPPPVPSASIPSSVDSDQPWTSSASAAETDTKKESLSSDSIWDVPDTPQARQF